MLGRVSVWMCIIVGAALLSACSADPAAPPAAAVPTQQSARMPTAQPTSAAATAAPAPTDTPSPPTAVTGVLQYLLPPHFADDFTVAADQTSASTTGFVVHAQIASREQRPDAIIIIAGGDQAAATVAENQPGGSGALIEPVTVRGQPGTIASSGLGATVAWTENRQPYYVSAPFPTREQVLSFVENLESMGQATWQQRVSAPASTSVTSGDAAIQLLIERVTRDNLYANLDCLSFMLAQQSREGYSIAVREKHGGSCPGNPNVAPLLDRFQVKSDGTILWLNITSGEYVPYEQRLRS